MKSIQCRVAFGDYKVSHLKMYGIKILNDSLIGVIDHRYDAYDLWNPSELSRVYPYHDSVRIDEVTQEAVPVSKKPEIGYSKSGVYNLNSRNWFVEPLYKDVRLVDGKIIAEQLIRHPETMEITGVKQVVYPLKNE